MIYITHYASPIGNLLLASKNHKLVGLWIENQKYYLSHFKEEMIENNRDSVLEKAKEWLDRYFNGEKPSIQELQLEPIGSSFQKNVWQILCLVPYGKVTTYSDIAKQLAKNSKKVSAQAVGGAVAHNPISIIIPCHRVVSKNGSLTGYAGGIDRKIYLLEHEQVDMTQLFVPTKGTTLS